LQDERLDEMNTSTNTSQTLSRYKGFIMVLTAAILWGLSGTVAQYLFQEQGFQVGWLVTIRLLLSGVLLLLISSLGSNFKQLFAIWRYPKDWIQLVVFGILGMLAVQYTYFAAIEAGNAATATLLQYLGPLFITIYLAIRFWRRPALKELVAVAVALLGVFFLVTNGTIETLSIPAAAIVWGLVSAVALAFYTLYPIQLLKKWNSALVVGWGMVIGGVGLSFVNPPWVIEGQQWSLISLGLVGFVIIFGTLIAFFLYLDSLRFIKPTETSLLASAEPLAAAVAAIVWLQIPFGLVQMIGGLCIICTVGILAYTPRRKVKQLFTYR
jgi:drug/metabolite transporter (DMT)-like permease